MIIASGGDFAVFQTKMLCDDGVEYKIVFCTEGRNITLTLTEEQLVQLSAVSMASLAQLERMEYESRGVDRANEPSERTVVDLGEEISREGIALVKSVTRDLGSEVVVYSTATEDDVDDEF